MKITQTIRAEVAVLTAEASLENNPEQAAHAADLLLVFDNHLTTVASLEQSTTNAISALNVTNPMVLTLLSREINEEFKTSVKILSDSDGQEKSEADELLIIVNSHLDALRNLELETFAKIDNELSHISDSMVRTHIDRLVRPE
jgi:hypothetical protein